jgi:hypothetical protein
MRNLAYKVFVDTYRLAYKYRFHKLNDNQWKSMISDADKLFKRYKNTDAEYLFRYLFSAVQSFYERVSK